MEHILVVDDQQGSRESIKAVFSKTHKVSLAESAQEALKILSEKRIDLILLDFMMPDKDGLSLLEEAKGLYPDLPIIMVSASSSVKPIVQAIRLGAHDYISKPFEVAELRRIVERALESCSLHRKIQSLEQEVSKEFPVHGIIGNSPIFLKALEQAKRAAQSDSTLVIYGESGTGKELMARYLHAESSRNKEPFVAVHCAALPEALMESELFGHEKGAFTNADAQKLGRFDLAGSGTLFFDEVAEMSLVTQVKLLRVLQEREYMRIGGTKIIHTNARIITATAKDLLTEVKEKRFRDDLYYRLSVVPIQLPPLRERSDDIPLLAKYFLGYFKQKIPATNANFSLETIDLLTNYQWPGNIRELRNIIERLIVLHGREELIKPEHLPDEFRKQRATTLFSAPLPVQSYMANNHQSLKLEEAVNSYEEELIKHALKESKGVQTEAAKLLGTTRRILKYRMEKLNISAPENSDSI
jgi:DNA-binding NtrC family response regulator